MDEMLLFIYLDSECFLHPPIKAVKDDVAVVKLVCFLGGKKKSHSALETFILYVQVIWEIFPLHKNRNACTFIEYSIFPEAAQVGRMGQTYG